MRKASRRKVIAILGATSKEISARLMLWRVLIAVPLLAFGLASAGHSTELNPAAVAYQTPDQFKWRDPANKGPNNGVNLFGDPEKPGLYVNLTKWNKGFNFSHPHFHPNDRFITVLSGWWWVGSGTAWDRDHAVPMSAGSFVTHYARQVHWDGAKDEDAVLLIVGEGPATSTLAQETQGELARLNPTAVTYKLPNQIEWKDTGANRSAVLFGDPEKPGLYGVMTTWLAGNNFSRPHFHPNDRFIMVLKGTWWVGTGNKFDISQTVPMKAGTFVTHFGKQVHWDGAKNEDAALLIVGEGPATSTRVEEAK
jgi:quercetin dioxygenase-like cupin family protein